MEPGENQSGLKKATFHKKRFLGNALYSYHWFTIFFIITVLFYVFNYCRFILHIAYRYKNPGVQWEQERDDPSYIPGLVTEPVESSNSIPGLVGSSSSSSSVNLPSKKKNKKKQKGTAGDDDSAASATAARLGALALNDDGADFELPDDVRAALGGGAANDRPKASHSQSEPSSKPGGHPKRKAKQKGAQSSAAAAESKWSVVHNH